MKIHQRFSSKRSWTALILATLFLSFHFQLSGTSHSLPPEEIAKSSSQGGVESETTPFRLLRNHMVVVTGRLAGLKRPVRMLIDTGSTCTCVDENLVRQAKMKRLPLPPALAGAFGRHVVAGYALVKGLTLGPDKITRSCLVVDLPWPEVDMIIGLDVLRKTNLTIDYKNRSVIWGGDYDSGKTLEFENVEGLMAVRVRMGEQTLRMAIDSGAFLGLVYQRRLSNYTVLTEARVKVSHLAGSASGRKVTVWNASMETVQLPRVPLVLLQLDNPGSRLDGFLSPSSLGFSRVHFNFAGAKVSFER